jgi:hypothetical protein
MQPKDITTRICWGAPPLMIVLPGPKGVHVQNARPIVRAVDESCSMFEPKTLPQIDAEKAAEESNATN